MTTMSQGGRPDLVAQVPDDYVLSRKVAVLAERLNVERLRRCTMVSRGYAPKTAIYMLHDVVQCENQVR